VVSANGTFDVDSFFDIEYRIASFDTEMDSRARHIFNDPDFDSLVLCAVKSVASKAGGSVYYGHVTVLK
jgi:hypothetical protein